MVAPELEFYLVTRNEDPDYPLVPPVGRNGCPETARQSFSIDAVNEFDPIFEDMYDYCEAQELEVDTLIHEPAPPRWRSTSCTGMPSIRRPGVSVQAHHARGRPSPRHLCHLHG